MKKIRLFSLFTLMVMLALVLLVGCAKNDKVSSICLKDHDAETVIEMGIGNFEYESYTLVVTYESGKTEELTLTEEMITEADLFKFYQEGEHDITLSYEKCSYVFKVSVKRLTFSDLSLPQNNVFVYDGKPHAVEVEGDMPANAVVTYIGGNSFTNAGTYDVKAVVSCEGYVTVRLSTTVTIERAKFDMSGVTFESKEFVYDGNAHSIEISGTLPEGVAEPTYFIDEMQTSSATNAGEYKVIAKFSNKNTNYEAIPDMEATLTITQAEYVIEGVEILFKNEDGKVIDGKLKVYDGNAVTFDINDYSKLSDKISVAFSVCDAEGTEISTSNINTGILNAGVYTAKAEFVLADSKNYKPIDPIACEFEVEKANYDMTGVHFDNDVVISDGNGHSLFVILPNDHDIKSTDITYEYYLDGELLSDSEGNPVQSVTETGEYSVKAIFAVQDQNYEQIEDMIATLRIEEGN